eukprot:2389043-Pleurochrysis_carterae.AAC.2
MHSGAGIRRAPVWPRASWPRAGIATPPPCRLRASARPPWPSVPPRCAAAPDAHRRRSRESLQHLGVCAESRRSGLCPRPLPARAEALGLPCQHLKRTRRACPKCGVRLRSGPAQPAAQLATRGLQGRHHSRRLVTAPRRDWQPLHSCQRLLMGARLPVLRQPRVVPQAPLLHAVLRALPPCRLPASARQLSISGCSPCGPLHHY